MLSTRRHKPRSEIHVRHTFPHQVSFTICFPSWTLTGKLTLSERWLVCVCLANCLAVCQLRSCIGTETLFSAQIWLFIGLCWPSKIKTRQRDSAIRIMCMAQHPVLNMPPVDRCLCPCGQTDRRPENVHAHLLARTQPLRSPVPRRPFPPNCPHN